MGGRFGTFGGRGEEVGDGGGGVLRRRGVVVRDGGVRGWEIDGRSREIAGRSIWDVWWLW